MLTKRRLKRDNVVKVTFRLPGEVEANRVLLLGDFNQWQPAHELARQRDGSWRITIALEPGRSYQFRYLADGARWLNDPAPDAVVPNAFGTENSVVHT